MNKLVIAEALKLHALGWSIIPVGKDKRPLLAWKEFQERVSTIDEIKLWFSTWPDANIAVVTGPISGIVVLDIDAKHNRSIKEFQIPPTIISKTGGGGSHVFFKYPGKLVPNSNGSLLGVGVDIKGDAGYAILPPSSHASGNNYAWQELCAPGEMELGEIPEWLSKKLFSSNQSHTPKLWEKDPSEIIEGGRNEAAASMAGKIMSLVPPNQLDTVGWDRFGFWNHRLPSPLPPKELRAVWESIKKYQAADSKEIKDKNESISQKIINIILNESDAMLFHNEQSDAYICIKILNRWEVWPCRSKNIKRLLSSIAWQKLKNPLGSEALKSIIAVLEGKAIFEGPKIKLSNRAALHENELWYDLTNEKWQAVRINKDGWNIIEKPPILFTRYSHNKSQVMPSKEGDVKLFLNYINITDAEQRLLLLVFLVSSFIPDYPHVMLIIFGSQGSSKSTLSKLMRLIIDPSTIEVASLPSRNNELIQMLAHHYFIFFDNLSYINDEQSDTICKAITGSGFAKRELYENDEDIIYSFMRRLGINGINLVANRADLLERSLLIELQRIDPRNRKSERELYENFYRDLPAIIGGVFEVLVKALKIKPTIESESLPRMADWTLWGCAIAEAMGYTKEKFLYAYENNIKRQTEMLLNENIVATAIITFMEDKDKWRSTPTDLLTNLVNQASFTNIDTREKYWPKGAGALSRRLNELSTPLKQMGFLVTISTSGTERWIEIQKTTKLKPDDTDSISQTI